LGKTPRVVPRGLDGVGRAPAAQLLFVDLKLRPSRQRQAQQPQAFRARRGLGLRLERRLRGWNKKQTRQLQFFTRRLGHEQMPEMHGIKRAAIKTVTLDSSTHHIKTISASSAAAVRTGKTLFHKFLILLARAGSGPA